MEDLARLLRDLRRRHARGRRDSTLTYRELAARTGWSQTAIAEYFTARTLPPTDRLDALLALLGATPAEQRALATARDRVEEANRRARGGRSTPPKAGAGPVPHQLPAPPGMFTGRVAELALLDAALDGDGDEGGPRLCAVGGMGGVGKTWLALHWAHAHPERFPDGELYADLRGFDPAGRPVDPAVVVRAFLEALGVSPAAIPAEQEAQGALYRGLTAGRRMLLVLDNALDTAQVVPLLPGGTSCAVLTTSRRRLTGLVTAHGAQAVALDVLPQDEARDLLAHHLGCGRLSLEPEAAAVLLACCAGLPLALGIVAACAATHPDLSLAALAAELADRAHRLDALDAGEPRADLRAVLSWSTRALSPDAARALGLLGIAPGPDVAPPAAARLLGLPPARTRVLLRELDHAHLVHRRGPERYRMHDLLRLHAAEHARAHTTAAERRAALRRVVGFYTETACAGARLLAPHRGAPPLAPADGEAATGAAAAAAAAAEVRLPLPDAAAAAGWFEAEHADLLAAQQAAHANGWAAQVWRLAWALDPYHRSRGHLEDQVAVWELAAAGADELPEPAVRAQARQLLGDAYAQLGRTGEALEHLALALESAERTGDVTARGEIHHSLGGAWERHGDDRRALEHALRALEVFRTLDDTYRQARALNGVGWLRTRLGRYAEACADCEAALALLRRHPADHRRLGESSTLDSLGVIAHRLGEHGRALAYFDRALAICRAQGHTYLEADVLDHIAEARLAQGDGARARAAWERSHALLTAQHRLAEAGRVRKELDRLAPPPGG